jgi:hypothetical protein
MTQKPNLMVPSAALDHVVDVGETTVAALTHLAESGIVFRKGRGLVVLVDEPPNGNRLIELTCEMLQTMLFAGMTVLTWKIRSKKAIVQRATEIKAPILKTIAGGIQVRELIKPITVIARRPYLVLVDGQLVQLQVGYNSARGGILVMGGSDPVDVPVEEAVESILALLQDFDFATPSDKSRAVAGFLCAVLRLAGIFERHPLLVFEADKSQTGKTKLWAMICAVLGQTYGPVIAKKGGVGSLDEQILERLVDGFVAILLDNMKGKLDSCVLEAFLTPEGGAISARIAGVRSIEVDPRPVLFGLTSNGVELTQDAANRAMMVRVRKRHMAYQFRDWTDGNGAVVGIREHIVSKQAYYAGCVNAIIRHWWANGALRNPCTQHDFRECMGALDFMVQKYFRLPPLLDGHQQALERTTKPGLTWLRQIAMTAANSWCVVDWTASRLAERCMSDGIAIPGAAGKEVDTEVAARLIGIAMSQVFDQGNRVEIEGIIVARTETTDGEGRLRRLYSFGMAKK